MNISPLSPGGYANAAAQDSFCANTSCVIIVIYDQENGLFSGANRGFNAGDASVSNRFVTAIVKGGPNQWAIRAGNAQTGSLSTYYSGVALIFRAGAATFRGPAGGMRRAAAPGGHYADSDGTSTAVYKTSWSAL